MPFLIAGPANLSSRPKMSSEARLPNSDLVAVSGRIAWCVWVMSSVVSAFFGDQADDLHEGDDDAQHALVPSAALTTPSTTSASGLRPVASSAARPADVGDRCLDMLDSRSPRGFGGCVGLGTPAAMRPLTSADAPVRSVSSSPRAASMRLAASALTRGHLGLVVGDLGACSCRARRRQLRDRRESCRSAHPCPS